MANISPSFLPYFAISHLTADSLRRDNREIMSLREELQKRIEKKQGEIRDCEDRIKSALAYIQGLQDTLKIMGKDDDSVLREPSLRHGSTIGKAHGALKAAGKPMHITEILKAIGQPTDKKNRLALGGSIAGYARKGRIFSKPAPNTFGLLEFESKLEVVPNVATAQTATPGNVVGRGQ
jgi:hypothetical protein